MTNFVFFYGTLMAGFDRRRRAGIDSKLTYRGRGSIHAALFDLGIYPAAVPAPEGRVWGEVYEMADPELVLAALDDIEGYRADDPDRSLYLPQPGGCDDARWDFGAGVGVLLQRAARPRPADRVGGLSRARESALDAARPAR